jgi:hypothetical protein
VPVCVNVELWVIHYFRDSSPFQSRLRYKKVQRNLALAIIGETLTTSKVGSRPSNYRTSLSFGSWLSQQTLEGIPAVLNVEESAKRERIR